MPVSFYIECLEGEQGGVLPRTKHIDESLAHKEAHRNPNSNGDHGSADVYAIPLSSNTSDL